MKNHNFTSGQDSMADKPDYVQLGLACADVCRALNRGTDGKGLCDLSQPACEAIEQLTMWVNSTMRGSNGSLMMFLMAEL